MGLLQFVLNIIAGCLLFAGLLRFCLVVRHNAECIKNGISLEIGGANYGWQELAALASLVFLIGQFFI